MFSFKVVLILAGVISAIIAGEPSPAIEVTGGKVSGVIEKSAKGRQFYAYRAIPYAAPPVGDNRLRPPKPVVPWEGTLELDGPGEYCAQSARGWRRGVEDCLHLSVYTPQLPSGNSEPLPVLVWLHGGSFVTGGAADYDPRLMMEKDMVIVVPQYRLGLLGFLYALESAPGNYGMLDQVAALKWVKENIAQFGGDPNRVTLGGDDAGGASALYHMVSPKSEGLFHGVISVSGSPLNPWARQLANRQTRMLYSLKMGCPRYHVEAMVKCFRNMDIDKILTRQPLVLDAYQRAPDLMYIGSNNNAPIVQSRSLDTAEENLFISEEPLIKFGQGRFEKVPVLFITARNEGKYVVENVMDKWVEKNREGEFNEETMKLTAEFMGIIDKDGKKLENLYRIYLPGDKGKAYSVRRHGIGEMLGDSLYNAGIMQTARYLNDHVPTYLFCYEYEKGPAARIYNRTDSFNPGTQAAGHGDMMHFFLPQDYQQFRDQEEKRVSGILTGIISNFVEGKQPSPAEWKQFTDDRLDSMTLKKDGQVRKFMFMPNRRVEGAEMMFKDHLKGPLAHLSRLLPRDEL